MTDPDLVSRVHKLVIAVTAMAKEIDARLTDLTQRIGVLERAVKP